MSIKRKILTSFMMLLISLTVVFIFSNSMQNKELSSGYSGSVYHGVVKVSQAVLGEKISISIFTVITHDVFRKIAHFSEFMLLGIEMCVLYICIKRYTKTTPIEILGFGLFVSSLDETIQLFFDRGAMIRDVCIDMTGFTFAFCIFAIVFLLKKFSRKK